MVDDNREQVNLYLPKDLKERLKSRDETMTDQMVEALEIYFGEDAVGNRQAIKRQIMRFREQKARGEQLIADGEAMVEEAERGIENLEQRLNALDAQSQSYEDDLDDLLATMREETISVWPGHGSLSELAQTHNKTESEVLSDLEERGDLNETYFTEGVPDPHAGTDDEDSDVPPHLRLPEEARDD